MTHQIRKAHLMCCIHSLLGMNLAWSWLQIIFLIKAIDNTKEL